MFFYMLQSESPGTANNAEKLGQVRGSIRARQFFAPAPRKAAANKKPPHVPVYIARFVTWPPTPSSIARHDALAHLLTAWNIRRESQRRNSEYSRYFYIEKSPSKIVIEQITINWLHPPRAHNIQD